MEDQNEKPIDALTIDGDLFKAIINDEEQYSIWPAKKEIPAGWHDTGIQGTSAEVSAYVDEHWTDMRPASLRKAMEARS